MTPTTLQVPQAAPPVPAPRQSARDAGANRGGDNFSRSYDAATRSLERDAADAREKVASSTTARARGGATNDRADSPTSAGAQDAAPAAQPEVAAQPEGAGQLDGTAQPEAGVATGATGEQALDAALAALALQLTTAAPAETGTATTAATTAAAATTTGGAASAAQAAAAQAAAAGVVPPAGSTAPAAGVAPTTDASASSAATGAPAAAAATAEATVPTVPTAGAAAQAATATPQQPPAAEATTPQPGAARPSETPVVGQATTTEASATREGAPAAASAAPAAATAAPPVATPQPTAVPAPTVDPATLQAAQVSGAARAEALAGPPSTAAVDQATLASQLGDKLAALRSLGSGQHVLQLRVTPDTFGPVRVVAQIGADGVRIELVGASDAAREALRAALPDLRRDLVAAGLRADLELGSGRSDSADTAGAGFGTGGRGEGSAPRGTAGTGAGTTGAAGDLPAATPTSTVSGDGRLDLLV